MLVTTGASAAHDLDSDRPLPYYLEVEGRSVDLVSSVLCPCTIAWDNGPFDLRTKERDLFTRARHE